MRRSIDRSLKAGLLTLFCAGLFAPGAQAIPAFARKTGLSCSACHEVWPRLNDFGQSFRDRGYRLKRDRDAPVEQNPSYWPIAFRTTAGYQFLRQALVQSDQGPITTNTGTFGFTGLDVWVAGTLGERVSFAITYTPGLGGAAFQTDPGNAGSGDLENAWIGLNDLLVENWVNLRVGKHALDLPIDEHRQITLTSGYNVYHFAPQGSLTTFAAGDNQAGVELYGHSDLSRVRYSFSLVNERDSVIFSNNVVSNPVVWGHMTAEQYLENGFLAAVKAGVFGSIGWHPTSFASLTPVGADGTAAGPPAQIQGSGTTHAKHYNYGAEAHLQFLSTVNPLTLTGVVWGGQQDTALGGPTATQDSRWLGAFFEGVYTYNPRLSLIGRYERIRTTQASDPTTSQGTGDLVSVTGAIRHTFEMSSRTEAALQLEVTRATSQAADGTLPSTVTGLIAFDFTM
jgi:hypothetical protein